MKYQPLRLLRIFGMLSAQIAATFVSPGAAAAASWFLEKNYVTLGSSNRYFDTVDVINRGSEVIFLKTSVTRLELNGGKRRSQPEENDLITVSPDEFAVGPGASFPVRILANPSGQDADSQSYYLRVTDISNLQANRHREGSASGYFLAYEAMVVVKKTPHRALEMGELVVLSGAEANTWWLKNQSGQHVFIADGFACKNNVQKLVDCDRILNFPRQSLLPGESVGLSYPGENSFLGVVVNSDISFRLPAKAMYLPMKSGQTNP